MKKKMLSVLMLSMLLFTSCGNSSSTVPPATSVNNESETENSIPETVQTSGSESNTSDDANEIQSEINSIADDYKPQDVTKSLNNICEYFEKQGLVSGERTEMAGEMIGAISGVKYEESKVEIYEYNTDSEKYKELVDTGKTTLEGYNVDFHPTAINHQFVIICDEADNNSQIIEEFSNLPE